MSANEYTIYLVNNSATTQEFWCFLDRPEELVNDPSVFANSNTYLTVPARSPAINTFTIPIQYVAGAGASNKAVGLNIKVDSNITKHVELKDTWEINYAPPRMGPEMQKTSTSSPEKTVSLKSNAFNRSDNEANGWFSNMSFGIKTSEGFMGMTWSPNPQTTRTLTPKFKFYVTTGTYGENELASWQTVSNHAAEISPRDFQHNQATVTLTEDGSWKVTPGKPEQLFLSAATSEDLSNLIVSQRLLSQALIASMGLAIGGENLPLIASPYNKKTAKAVVKDVKWKNDKLETTEDDVSNPIIKGNITVGKVIAAGFGFMVISGLRFRINNRNPDGVNYDIQYNGPEAADRVRQLVRPGKDAYFENENNGALESYIAPLSTNMVEQGLSMNN